MTGAEWVEAGCPISLSDEQITAIEEATRLEAQYEKPQADEADWFAKSDSIISRNDWDFTVISGMPVIDFDKIDEIPL
jgi:hypothetical protein